MSVAATDPATLRAGDRIEVRGLPGRPSRRGTVLAVLARGHLRVRWDDGRVSVTYPADGAVARLGG